MRRAISAVISTVAGLIMLLSFKTQPVTSVATRPVPVPATAPPATTMKEPAPTGAGAGAGAGATTTTTAVGSTRTVTAPPRRPATGRCRCRSP